MEESKSSRSKRIEEHELQGWNLLERFVRVLEEAVPRAEPGSREDHGLRTLERRAYLSLTMRTKLPALNQKFRVHAF